MKTDLMKRLMVEKGVKPEEIALKLGVSAQTIGNYIRGRSKPLPPAIEVIARMLGVDVATLCPEDDEPKIAV